MAKHLLDAKKVEKAKPRAKSYRLADGDGLYLYVPPSGVKAWQYRYRHAGRPQTATLGKLAYMPLSRARELAEEARGNAASGDQLTQAKRVTKASKRAQSANTFKSVADAWLAYEARASHWTPGHRVQAASSLENHLAGLNELPMTAITAAVASPLLRSVERSAPAMASKIRQRLRAILDYAVEGGIISGNPLPAPRRGKRNGGARHLPAVLKRDGIGAILRAADTAEACRGIKRAHFLAAFTAQRVGEIVGAKWSEFDLDAGVWSIPRERMKRRDAERGPHLVPIPPRLLAQIREWRRADGEAAEYVLPAPRGGGSVTCEGVQKFYRGTLGLSGTHSPHSWRAVLSTWANDAGEDADAVEAQLDHVTGTPVKTAYDRAQRLDRRADLMKWHEDALIAARDGAKVLDIARGRNRNAGA
jgi:integrase